MCSHSKLSPFAESRSWFVDAYFTSPPDFFVPDVETALLYLHLYPLGVYWDTFLLWLPILVSSDLSVLPIIIYIRSVLYIFLLNFQKCKTILRST